MRSLKGVKTIHFLVNYQILKILKTTMMDRTGIARTKDSLEKQLKYLEEFDVNEWVTQI